MQRLSSYGSGHFGSGSSNLGSRNHLLPHDDQVDACGQAAADATLNSADAMRLRWLI